MKNLLKELRNHKIHISLYEEDLKLKFSDIKPCPVLVAKIRENKSEIIEYLRQEVESSTVSTAIPKSPISDDGYPLSSSQLRLWILSQMEEGSLAYNMPFHIFMNIDFDVDLFKKSVEAVIRRHEILRTVFRANDAGEIRQWIMEPEAVNVVLDYKDFSDKDDAETLAMELVEEDSFRSFDLVSGPLVRIKLIKLADRKTLFYYNMHHIISDGWSMEVIAKDTMEFYNAYLESRRPSLPQLDIQYKDYAQWQLQELESGRTAQQRKYWMDKFSGDLPVLDLPSHKDRPSLKTNNGRLLTTFFSKKDTSAVKRYVSEKGGTLFMFLLSSLNVLFHRYTGQEDIIVGSPIAGRKHADLEAQIGFYVNTLALRNSITKNMSFDELYENVKQNLLGAYAHQMYPFDKLVEDLKLNRDTSRNALFEIMVVLQNRPIGNEKLEALSNVEVGVVNEDRTTKSRFDLEFNFEETDEHLGLSLTYNTDVYDYEMITALMSHYQLLLKEIVKNSEGLISEFNYLSQEEKTELLYDYNRTLVDYSRKKTFIDFFEEQVLKTPNHVALRQNGETLSYQALNERANAIAHYLIDKGITSETNVGVLFNRSFDMIISLVGVLKAGGSYVPIDPEYPLKRQRYIAENSKVNFILTEDGETALEKEIPGVTFIRIAETKIAGRTFENPRIPIQPEQLAYTIYTSGSTGNPKGVMIEHFSMINLVRWVNDTFSINEKDRLLCITSVCFDLSVYDIFGMLITGGSIYIATKEDIPHLGRIITDEEITFWDSVPTTFNYLIDDLSANQSDYVNQSLRLVFMSGDWIPVTLPDRSKPFFPNAEVISLGGATEGTVWSNYYPINEVGENWKSIPYGKPIINNFFYVLDDNLQPVPKGVVGELFIGGVGVARGYDNNPEKTKNSFVKDPFNQTLGGRMYKTGDLGRWMHNGNMEFIGRKDNQVKIRGFRVELGEIDSALSKYEGLKESITSIVKDQNNQNQLCAYIIPNDQYDKDRLKNYLKAKVPKYMMPSYYVLMDALPLNSNGKIDRKQLPAPEKIDLVNEVEYIAPRTEIEKELVAIWERTLDRKPIGIKDDFFDLGGHSLKQIKLANTYSKKFNVELKLQDLFALTTIEKHAEVLDAQSWLINQDVAVTENQATVSF